MVIHRAKILISCTMLNVKNGLFYILKMIIATNYSILSNNKKNYFQLWLLLWIVHTCNKNVTCLKKIIIVQMHKFN